MPWNSLQKVEDTEPWHCIVTMRDSSTSSCDRNWSYQTHSSPMEKKQNQFRPDSLAGKEGLAALPQNPTPSLRPLGLLLWPFGPILHASLLSPICLDRLITAAHLLFMLFLTFGMHLCSFSKRTSALFLHLPFRIRSIVSGIDSTEIFGWNTSFS